MSSCRQIRLVLNSRSGTNDLSPETLCKSFSGHGCVCVVTLLDRRFDLAALHRSDADDVVWIAAGGDGTVNCVAHALAGTGRTMGVLPIGTLNHFAQDLGIPAGLEEAIELAATGEVRRIDAAEVNGRTFVNNSSLGVYPAMVLDRDRIRKRGASKGLAMALASVRALVRFRRLRIVLQAESEVQICTTALLLVGNNVYGADGEGVERRKRLDRGVLSVFFAPNASRFRMVRLVISALTGRKRRPEDLEMFHVEHFVVSCLGRRRLRVSMDGEVHQLEPPLVYKSRPGALHVIGPHLGLG